MDSQILLRNLYLHLLNVDECLASNWNFQKVTSPFSRIYLVKSGGGKVIHNNRIFDLKPGHMYLIPSFTICNYSSETFLGHYYIHFIPQITGGTNLYKMFRFHYELEATDTDLHLMDRILELNPCRKLRHADPSKYCSEELLPRSTTDGSDRQIADHMESHGILLQLFSKFIKPVNDPGTSTNTPPNSKIHMVIDHIQMNLSKPMQLSELAGLCHLSGDYFSRLFMKTMGIRPIDYINRKRIEEAQLQLVATGDPIEKIALDVGIDNFSYFNRLFKKYSCNTPGEYRKLHRLV
jgi:AraC-like DNA-binding protein